MPFQNYQEVQQIRRLHSAKLRLCLLLSYQVMPYLSNITTGEILHYIDDNYGNDLTLPGLAKKFGLSESGLSKKIKAFTNMTFKEYLTKTRIEAAKSLLISSEKSITEIAVLCGYNSSNFFGDVFKKNMGMSPSSYKKMLTMN